MKLLRVAAAALNQTPLDWDANAANIRAAIDEARRRGASLLCLPELCVTGYGCEDAFHSHAVVAMAEEVLGELLPDTASMAVSIGLPVVCGGAVYNATALAVDGRVVGVAAKQRLAGDGLHYEPRWFKAWPRDTVASVTLAGRPCPIGDLVFDLAGVRLGFEICEDAWVAGRPGEEHARRGADLILNPSASHFAFGKRDARRRLVAEASRALGVTYVYSNLLGNEAGRVIYDGHTLIATHGEIVASGPRLAFAPVTVIDAAVDLDATRMRRAQSASFEPLVADRDNRLIKVDFALAACPPGPAAPIVPNWEDSPRLEFEEFTRAIALGLFDYLRKSRSRGFVVSLSGGADSSAVASLVAMMTRLAAEAYGEAQLTAALGLGGPTAADAEDAAPSLVRRLLTTVYQATRNSSERTRSAARAVAEALGAQHYELNVDDICDRYTYKIEQALGRDLRWRCDDVALQNIQARVRGPSAWMLANIKGALLLATSNRSEAAVGYATMDGDTCGGISPIAGIDKAFLRRWLRWLETEGPEGLGPIPALAAVNALPPTAELRPGDAAQTDEADLMPYDVLEAIEDQAIGEKRSPLEVLTALDAAQTDYSREQLAQWIRRFFELWSRNQWKRERYAPSFHVDDKNLDPKTWCRFPILSGGFRRELAALDAAASSGK